jgi:hypothetical protein
MKLVLTDNKLSSTQYWHHPIEKEYKPTPSDVYLFDVNGYDLCNLEQEYARVNGVPSSHRYKQTLKQDWFTSEEVVEGAHINHALLFERKGYNGAALEQLKEWRSNLALVGKLINIKPKWGIDLSIDYADKEGNVFEVFHYEWDSFNYENVLKMKTKIEELALSTDWNDAAKALLKRKNEWMHLPFFEQSDWKCNYYGIQPEQFKEIVWNETVH